MEDAASKLCIRSRITSIIVLFLFHTIANADETIYPLQLHSDENLKSVAAWRQFPVNCSFLCGWRRRTFTCDLSSRMQKGRYQFLKRHTYSCVRIICKTRWKPRQIFARRRRHFPRTARMDLQFWDLNHHGSIGLSNLQLLNYASRSFFGILNMKKKKGEYFYLKCRLANTCISIDYDKIDFGYSKKTFAGEKGLFTHTLSCTVYARWTLIES